MWARVVEVMLAVWLLVSPFVFRHSAEHRALWASDLICASLVAILALLSYWQPTRHAHLLTIVVAIWMVGFGRFSESVPLAPGLQNNIVVGLMLMMFAIVPNHASRPPLAWFSDAAVAGRRETRPS